MALLVALLVFLPFAYAATVVERRERVYGAHQFGAGFSSGTWRS